MSGSGSRGAAAEGFKRIRRDSKIEMIPHSAELTTSAVRLFAGRLDKNWSLTDCSSFVIMGEKGVREALTADSHFEQAGFRAVLGSDSAVSFQG
jgi:predicted nucleic acid-binding protein